MRSSLTVVPGRSGAGRNPKPDRSDLTADILRTVALHRECRLEALVEACSSYTWNQVFLEVDRMSRAGQLRLNVRSGGEYSVCIPTHSPAA
jgi:hypothetical protein